MQPRCLGLTSCPCSHCSNPRPAGSPSALPGSKMLHVCVCTDAWKQAHTGRDAVLAVHTESFLLMYRHGHPAAASAQKPALVLEQYLQSLQQGNKWISLKMSSWEERQSRPSLRSHLLAFTCYPSVLVWCLQRSSVVLPMSLCVDSRTTGMGNLVPPMESVKAASLLSCSGECQSGNDRAFDQCTNLSSSFPLIPLVSPTLEL